MTFDSREHSIAGGEPIRLYEFQRGALRWMYTNADRDIEFQNQLFKAIAISDNGIRQSGETSADEIVITVPWNTEFAQQFRGVPPSDEIFILLRDLHFGEPEAREAGEGTVVGVRWPSPERAEIRCQPLSSSFDRPGLRLAYERGCPYSVFDINCGLDPADFKVDANIQSIEGSSIQSSTFGEQDDGWFAGGYLEWPIGAGQFERRTIVSHVEATLVLLGGTGGLSAGLAVSAYPGCARVASVCDEKFDNLEQYGGFHHMPGKSPFDGDPIF